MEAENERGACETMTPETFVPHPPDDETFEVTIRFVRLPRGGYVIAETGTRGGPVQAVTRFDEMVSAVGGFLKIWDDDMSRQITARYQEENPTLVVPKRGFFQRRG